MTADPGRSGGTRVRWLAVAVAVVVVATGAVLGRSGLDAQPEPVDSPLIGAPAPDTPLPALEGDTTLRLSDLRGDVVVVNFWASWCVPCRQEHPVLTGAASQYRDDGVQVVGISYQDGDRAARQFLDELGRGGDTYRYVTDPGSRAAIEFGVFGVPETFVVDRAGTVVAKFAGAVTAPALSAVLDDVLAPDAP